MSMFHYLIITLVIVVFAIFSVLLSNYKNKTKATPNITFQNEIEYLNYVKANSRLYILISPKSREVLFNNKFKLILRNNNEEVKVEQNKLIKEVAFSDVLQLLSGGVKLTPFFKISNRYSLEFKPLEKRDVPFIISNAGYDQYFKNNVGQIKQKDDESNKIVSIDLNLYSEIDQLITKETKVLSLRNGTVKPDIDMMNVTTLKLRNVSILGVKANNKINSVYFSNMKIESLNLPVQKIYVRNCEVANFNFNPGALYEIRNVSVPEEVLYTDRKNVAFSNVIFNEFKLKPLGSLVKLDDVDYFITGYFKKFESTFFYYMGRNIKTNEVAYFNPLSLSDDNKKSLFKNLDVLEFYNNYLPKRNRADTYINKITTNDYSYDIDEYSEDIIPYLKYYNLIRKDTDAKRIESQFININDILDIYLKIEYFFLKDVISKDVSIEKIVGFYESCFIPRLINSRVEFITLSFKKKLFYKKELELLYTQEYSLNARLEFIINAYEKNYL